MVLLSMRQRWTCYAVAAAAYFIVAYWLKVSFVPPTHLVPNISGEKIRLRPPFEGFLKSRFAVISVDHVFGDLADTLDNDRRSPILIYEGDRRLGPAHSTHAEVGDIGQGRYSHYRDQNKHSIFLFSTSDNTDPITNGREYWAVKPDTVEAPPEP